MKKSNVFALGLSLAGLSLSASSWAMNEKEQVESCQGGGFSVQILRNLSRRRPQTAYAAKVFRAGQSRPLAELPVQFVQGTGVFHFWNEPEHFYLSIDKFAPSGRPQGRSGKLSYEVRAGWRIDEALLCRP